MSEQPEMVQFVGGPYCGETWPAMWCHGFLEPIMVRVGSDGSRDAYVKTTRTSDDGMPLYEHWKIAKAKRPSILKRVEDAWELPEDFTPIVEELLDD